ncbi:uncharacterized protein GIIIspla2 [Calliphora vicina]|uniref:uncharacterized protein GIIIspla2 n=1 Tax=Calliphora vicina TaxID=7373 RepID=UPI00325AA8BE
MKKFLNLIIFVTIFVTLAGSKYVPEETIINVKDYVSEKHEINAENKPLHRDLQQSGHQYLLKLNNNEDNDDNDEHNYDGQQSLFNAQQAKTNAHQLQPIPMQQKSYDIDDDVVVKAKNRTNNVYENLEAQPTGLAEQQQQHHAHNNDVLLANNADDNDESYATLPHSRQKRQLSDFLIAPNTRWCGRGNTANGTYNHLGGASMADKCCRTHDHCKLYIPAMSNRFDLFNYRPYTLSHCNCDRRFRTCLKMASDEDANTIGKLFFNLVQTQCFVLTKEVVCQQRGSDGTCLKEHIKQKAYLRNNKKY